MSRSIIRLGVACNVIAACTILVACNGVITCYLDWTLESVRPHHDGTAAGSLLTCAGGSLHDGDNGCQSPLLGNAEGRPPICLHNQGARVGQGMVHQSLTPYHCTAKQGEQDTQYIANENACTDLGLSYTSTCVDEGPDDIGVSVLAGNKQRCGAIYLRHRSKQATHE